MRSAERHRGTRDGRWLDILLSAYRGDEQIDDDGQHRRRGEKLAKATTVERIAGLEEGIELLYEGLEEHEGDIAKLERELTKPFPDKALLCSVMLAMSSSCDTIVDTLAGISDDLRRWSARSKAADRQAMTDAVQPLIAVNRELNDLYERLLDLKRRILARFSEAELEAAYEAALVCHLRSIGEDAETFKAELEARRRPAPRRRR